MKCQNGVKNGKLGRKSKIDYHWVKCYYYKVFALENRKVRTHFTGKIRLYEAKRGKHNLL